MDRLGRPLVETPDVEPILDGAELDMVVLWDVEVPREEVDVGDSGVTVVPLLERPVEEMLWLETD